MKLEEMCVSLELAKRLKELGVNQESYFYYHWYKKNRDWEHIDCLLETDKPEEFDDGKWKLKVYSAFTASELLEMLPKTFTINRYQLYKSYTELANPINRYSIYLFYPNVCEEKDESLLTTLAKMLIYLIENKLMDIK